MGTLISALAGRFGIYIVIALATVVAGLAITIKVQTASNNALREKLLTEQVDHSIALVANAGQSQAITELEGNYTILKNECTATAASAAESAKRANDYALERDRLSGELERLEAKDRATPECDALLHTDLARVCPAIANGLRQRAGQTSGSRSHR